MKRVVRHIIRQAHRYYQEIDGICLASKNLYNSVMYTARHSFFYGYGVPSWGKLDEYFRESDVYKALPAKVSQLVIKQVSDAWDSYFKALAAYKEDNSDCCVPIHARRFTGKPKIPGYKNPMGRNLVKYNNQAYCKRELVKEAVLIPSKTNLKIPVAGITQENLVEVRLVPKYGYYVIEVVYETGELEISTGILRDARVSTIDKVAAIDLGLDNLATVVFNTPDVNPFIINGKPLKSVNQRWHKEKAHLQSLLPQGQYTSSLIEAITRKRNCYVDNYIHHATRRVVEELKQVGVSKVVVGKNQNWKRQINLGRVNNQNFVQIPYKKFIDILIYKLEAIGIEVIVAEESYTSKASFLDWDNIPTYDPEVKQKHKFSGRRIRRAWYKASDGTLIHADVNGAYNIGRKVVPKAFDYLKSIVQRDRGWRVVHPRRITPAFRRVHAQPGVAQNRVK